MDPVEKVCLASREEKFKYRLQFYEFYTRSGTVLFREDGALSLGAQVIVCHCTYEQRLPGKFLESVHSSPLLIFLFLPPPTPLFPLGLHLKQGKLSGPWSDGQVRHAPLPSPRLLVPAHKESLMIEFTFAVECEV